MSDAWVEKFINQAVFMSAEIVDRDNIGVEMTGEQWCSASDLTVVVVKNYD